MALRCHHHPFNVHRLPRLEVMVTKRTEDKYRARTTIGRSRARVRLRITKGQGRQAKCVLGVKILGSDGSAGGRRDGRGLFEEDDVALDPRGEGINATVLRNNRISKAKEAAKIECTAVLRPSFNPSDQRRQSDQRLTKITKLDRLIRDGKGHRLDTCGLSA